MPVRWRIRFHGVWTIRYYLSRYWHLVPPLNKADLDDLFPFWKDVLLSISGCSGDDLLIILRLFLIPVLFGYNLATRYWHFDPQAHIFYNYVLAMSFIATQSLFIVAAILRWYTIRLCYVHLARCWGYLCTLATVYHLNMTRLEELRECALQHALVHSLCRRYVADVGHPISSFLPQPRTLALQWPEFNPLLNEEHRRWYWLAGVH